MDGVVLILLLIGWVYGGALILMILPTILEGLFIIFWACAVWLFELLVCLLIYLYRSLVKLALHYRKPVAQAFTLLYFIIAELVRPAAIDDEQPNDDTEPPDQDAGERAYEIACALLTLLPNQFTPKELKLAYRRAISAVHPDRGGSHEDAQAINEARDLILAFHGW